MKVKLDKTLSKFGEEFDDLLAKLNALTILDEGEKLSIYDNVLYIDGTWYQSIQSITRYILNQGRTQIFHYLKEYLMIYIDLLTKINSYDGITRHDINLRKELLGKSKLFFENAKLGFAVLKYTYPNYKSIHHVIDDYTKQVNIIHLGFSPTLQSNIESNIESNIVPKI